MNVNLNYFQFLTRCQIFILKAPIQFRLGSADLLAGFGEGKGRRGREETRKKGERTGKWAGKREGGAMKGGKNGEGRKTWGK